MNRIQQLVVFLSTFTIVVLCLRPPCQLEQTAYIVNRESKVPHKATSHANGIGHRWLWHLPQGATEESFSIGSGRVLVSSTTTVDWPHLGVYVGVTIAVGLFAALILFNDKFSKPD